MSGVAVVITLIFLIAGIRENTAIIRASMYANSFDSLIENRRERLRDPDLVRIYDAYLNQEVSTLDELDRLRLREMVLNTFQIFEKAYFSKRYDLLGDAEWQRFERRICVGHERINAAGMAETVSSRMTEEFMEYVATICQE